MALRANDQFLGRPIVGGLVALNLPILRDKDEEDLLGGFTVAMPVIVFLDTLLGFVVEVGRMSGSDFTLANEEELHNGWTKEAVWREDNWSWKEEEENGPNWSAGLGKDKEVPKREKDKSLIKDKVQGKKEGNEKENTSWKKEPKYQNYDEDGWWGEEQESNEEADEKEEDEEVDEEAWAAQQGWVLGWVEQKVEGMLGVDGRVCVQRFICELHQRLHNASSSASSSPPLPSLTLTSPPPTSVHSFFPSSSPPPPPPLSTTYLPNSISSHPSTHGSFSAPSSSLPLPSFPNFKHRSLLGQALHILFSPRKPSSSSSRRSRRSMEHLRPYHEARTAGEGGKEGRMCRETYHQCPMSLFKAFGGFM